jgi:hypothetical protein
MPGLNELADWLGIEVIDVEGEAVVRQRINARGKWVEREARATAVEVKLYDAVRGLLGASLSGVDTLVVAKLAAVLGLGEAFTPAAVMEKLADLLADNRHWREKANGTDEALVECRGEVQTLRAQLLDASRLAPKGGDRGEAARRVREVTLTELDHAVGELKAARWRQHEPGSRPEMACRGEQNAFSMVQALLRGESVEGLEL